MSELLGRMTPLWDFYNQLLDGVVLLDEKDHLVDCNQSALTLLSLQNLKGVSGIEDRIRTKPPLNSEEFKRNLVHGERKVKGNAILHNGNGELKDSAYQCYFITDDVTDEHLGKLVFFHAPDLLVDDSVFFSQKTELLHALNGCTSEMVTIINPAKQAIVFANNFTSELLGWSKDDFIDGGFGFGLSIVHPQDLPSVRETHTALMEKVRASINVPTVYDAYTMRLKTKQGSFVKMHFRGSVLERSSDGNIALMLAFGRPDTESHPEFKLTPREIEVARLLVQGHSSKMIAAAFNLSIHTVNDYRSQLMKKLGTTNTAALVNYLIEKKLI